MSKEENKSVLINRENVVKRSQKLRNIIGYVSSFFPFFLSHHPECDRFEGHTQNIRNIRLCIGCFFGYPAAIAVLIFHKIFNLYSLLSPMILLILGIAFISTFFMSPLKLTNIKFIKIIQKILMGIGSSFVILWILQLPNPRNINLFLAITVINLLLLAFGLYHVYGIWSNCVNCDTPFDWGYCDGFRTIIKNFEEKKLPNFLEKFHDYSISLKNRKNQCKDCSNCHY